MSIIKLEIIVNYSLYVSDPGYENGRGRQFYLSSSRIRLTSSRRSARLEHVSSMKKETKLFASFRDFQRPEHAPRTSTVAQHGGICTRGFPVCLPAGSTRKYLAWKLNDKRSPDKR